MNPDDNPNLFIENFKRIKDLGFVQSHRSHNTGIGKTLEDLMGIEENNLEEPDFGNIEIKSQRALSKSKVTLFTKAPKPRGTNSLIREKYGYFDAVHPTKKVLRMRMNNTFKWNTIKSGWDFRLRMDEPNNKIHLEFRNTYSKQLGDVNGYYLFDEFHNSIRKINTLAFVSTKHEKRDGDEYFHFTNCRIYTGLTYELFLRMVLEGIIVYEIRLGLYSNGKYHDHGSGFRVDKNHMSTKLYDSYIDVG